MNLKKPIKFLIFICLSFCSLLANKAKAEDFKILKNPIHIQSIDSKRQDNGSRVFELKLEIAKDHFLYFDDLLIVSELEGLNNSSFEVEASPIYEFKDKFSKGEIKKGLKDHGLITFKVPFGFNYNSKFILSYRACTEEFCYLPKTLAFEHGQVSQATDNINNPKSDFSFFKFNLDFNSSPVALIFLIVFLAGILTSFTPCIFPLIPITLALIQNNVQLGRFKSFQKTFVFILGIAFTYSLLGLLAASTGTFFGSLLANPYALITISLIYFVMALSLFGLFEIQFFNRLQNKVSKISTHSNFGVFLFGMVTGIFASPCVGPILIAILTYAAQTKNLTFSFFLLFTYAIGLGQIFLVLSLFSNLINKLPRSGSWLNGIKYFLGILLILAGLFFFIPAIKSISTNQTVPYSVQLEQALKSKKILIVDFKADWCGACKELELKTFKNPKIKTFLDNNEFLAIDVTVTTPDTNELLQKYGVIGLPHVMFFDKKGNLLPELTISSYISAEEMLKKIESIKAD
jgi:thiol:disulfide interchange protein